MTKRLYLYLNFLALYKLIVGTCGSISNFCIHLETRPYIFLWQHFLRAPAWSLDLRYSNTRSPGVAVPAATLCKQLRWRFSDLLRLCALPCHKQTKEVNIWYFFLIFLNHIAPLDWWLWLLFEHKVSIMPYIKHVKQAVEKACTQLWQFDESI